MQVDAGVELASVIDAIRLQLVESAEEAAKATIQFPVTGVELEFHVGVTKAAEAKGGVRFWVLELGGGGSYEAESVQTVRVKLGEPQRSDGTPLRVTETTTYRP